MITFKDKDGWCHTCSLTSHAKELVHEDGSYGTKQCTNRNCIRFVTAVFEDDRLRQDMIRRFPSIRNMTSNEEIVEWMRKTDQRGHTWYADVVKWIKEEVISSL